MASNSDSSTLQEDQKQIQFEASPKPNSEFPNGCGASASIEPENSEEEEETEETESTGSSSSLEIVKNMPFLGVIEVSENDDGFKTPTDQMIPAITECPGAPKKQRKQETRKRKASRTRRCLRVEFSEEIESIFGPAIQEEDFGRENKRTRSEKTE